MSRVNDGRQRESPPRDVREEASALAGVVGARLPSIEFEWSDRDVVLYALGVGAGLEDERRLIDETRGLQVLPTFALIANWWCVRSMRSCLPPTERPMVHAHQNVTVRRPIPASGGLAVDAYVSGVFDTGKHALVEVTSRGTDGADTVFVARSGTMILGAGGFGGETPSRPDGTPDDQQPIATVDQHVAANQTAIYRLSGDRNPLHIDPDAARRAGFDDVFLHGLCTLGFAARALVGALCPDDVSRLESISCRFAKPVFLDRSLTTAIWESEPGQYSFTTSQGGTAALTHGTAQVRDEQ